MQMVLADYMDYEGRHYLVMCDRYSGWPEVVRASQGTNRELLSYLREWFGWYSVPKEMTTDGGPQFTSSEANDFFNTWGV